ncbi:MAG: restriction endonuclease [Acidobacteriota bacterium]|nr:restriction endonuclease [Acidobacteriota bacterium]
MRNINDEMERRKIREQIVVDNSHTYRECVESYLKIYKNQPTFSSAFQNLIFILKERSLYNENDIDDLRYELTIGKFQESTNDGENKAQIQLPEEIGYRKKQQAENIIKEINKRKEKLTMGWLNSSNKIFQQEIVELEKELLELNSELNFDLKKEKFLESSQYLFVKNAIEDLINGVDIDYSMLKKQIGKEWKFSTNQLSKLISAELEREGLSLYFLQEQIEKKRNFYNSSSYKYIKQFAKKYGGNGKTEDYNQLQTLLKNWQWEFSSEELKTFVLEANKKQKSESLKSKILADKPHNRGAILKIYLNFYRSNDEINLMILANLLEERYSTSENISSLKIELQTIEKRIELENFEKRLLEEDEQVQLEEIDNLNGYEFEDFLKTLFSKMGYQVEQTRLSGDQGADLVVVKFGEKRVIQAKRFGGKVGNKAVQEIMAAISLYRAQKGVVITNNYFTPAAVELANANNIELVDRDALEELINKHW